MSPASTAEFWNYLISAGQSVATNLLLFVLASLSAARLAAMSVTSNWGQNCSFVTIGIYLHGDFPKLLKTPEKI